MSDKPAERIDLVVLVEQGGHGSTTAAPIARHIIEGLYGLEYSGILQAEVGAADAPGGTLTGTLSGAGPGVGRARPLGPLPGRPPEAGKTKKPRNEAGAFCLANTMGFTSYGSRCRRLADG